MSATIAGGVSAITIILAMSLRLIVPKMAWITLAAGRGGRGNEFHHIIRLELQLLWCRMELNTDARANYQLSARHIG